MFGYEFKTSFWTDFSIADHFGANAIKETFRSAFNDWKNNYVFLTELVIVLNWKSWEHCETGREDLSKLYVSLWELADAYAAENLKGEELSYFYRTTD